MAFPRVWLPRHPQISSSYAKGVAILAERLQGMEPPTGAEEGWILYLAASGWAQLPLQEHLHRLARAGEHVPLAIWADWHVLCWSGARAHTRARLPRWQAILERVPGSGEPREQALAYLDRWALDRMAALLGQSGASEAAAPPPIPSSSPWAELVRWAGQGPPTEEPPEAARSLPDSWKDGELDLRPLFVELAAHHQAWDWAHALAVEPAPPMASVPLTLRGLLGLDPDGSEGALVWHLLEPPPLAVEELAVGPARVHLRAIEETGAGLQVQVIAEAPLYLEMVTATHHFSEALTPGLHRYRLTSLDRTDWAG